jgi:hypothetical protein
MEKRWQILFASLFLIFSFGLFPSFAQENANVAAKAPKIVFTELTFDMKEVKEGEAIEHSFEVQNKGDDILKIERVKPG